MTAVPHTHPGFLLALVLLLASVPSVAGQSMQLDVVIDPPQVPLEVDDNGTATITIRRVCANLAQIAPETTLGVTFTVPEGIKVDGPGSLALPEQPCALNEPNVVSGKYTVRLAESVPNATTFTVGVEVTDEGEGTPVVGPQADPWQGTFVVSKAMPQDEGTRGIEAEQDVPSEKSPAPPALIALAAAVAWAIRRRS